MTKFLIPLFGLLLFFFSSEGQTLYKGKIINKVTEISIPFAHLRIDNTNIGTVANSNGEFSIVVPNRYLKNDLVVSCMGYKNEIFPISKLSDKKNIIRLEEETNTLATVEVLAVDIARLIVERAIDRIPQNYPANSERLIGFTREIVSPDSNFQMPYYIGEAEVEALKEGYEKRVKNGDVKLIKGRNYIGENYENINVRFYGGAHDQHNFDWVAKRSGPLNKKNLDKYVFDIADTLRQDGRDIIVVSFKPENNVNSRIGKLHIADETYAIARIENYHTIGKSQSFENSIKSKLSGYNRLYMEYQIDYTNYDSLWRFSHGFYKTAFNKENDFIYLKSQYVTTDFYQSEEAIPYADRVQYRDVFLNKVQGYDPEFWEGHNVMPFEHNIPYQSKDEWEKSTIDKRSRTDKIISILERFRTSFALVYGNSISPRVWLDMNQLGTSWTGEKESMTSTFFGYSSFIKYELGKSWIVGFEEISSFATRRFRSQMATIEWERKLFPRSRPVYLSLGAKTGYSMNGTKLGDFRSDQRFELNGRRLDSGGYDVIFESRGFGVVPFMSLSLEKSRRLKFYGEASLPFILYNNYGVHIKEQRGLFKKSVWLKEKDYESSIQVSEHSNNERLSRNGILSAGIVLSF
ncbi:carboxypeptidase-like regulatory domain-containing protein [Belliella sp. DSM 107340]|uniref:Carboxypeptidase-like regulatory domain-containing protein n=1 Tax=Belliella calami TaxID=2923436 RepID=A0ABS9UQY9_9BACT|nr:carboxypeptidase-like regulatory domain-containing protein [Belliella calami]MCH7399035.1 carboxypeptidase-like regulatory domain-containing protein [Belliella calami]